VAVPKFVPLGKGMEALRKLPPRILRQGVSVGPTPALKHHVSQEGIFGGVAALWRHVP